MGWIIASAITWHVATTGSDSAAGTPAAPLLTIQAAASRASSGDTVVVHPGTYAGFAVTTSGVAFSADGAVTIDGASTTGRDAITIEGASAVTIEGFHVTGARRAGIAALDCDHVTVRRNRVDANARWGVFSSFCDDLLVEDNEVSRSGTEHGIYASNSADRPVLRRNQIWGNAMCGVHLNGDIHMGGDGVISSALIEGNTITDNGRLGGSGINGDGITGARIVNNVLEGNHASGISLYREDGGAPSTGNLVINNTIRQAADARYALNVQNGSTANTARNNLVIHPNPANVVDRCAICALVEDHDAFGEGAAVIDAGSAVDAPATDIDGVPRPQGAGIDIGAREQRVDDPGQPPGGAGDPFSGAPPDDEMAPPSGGCDASHPVGGMMIGIALLVVRRQRRWLSPRVTRRDDPVAGTLEA